MNKIYCYVDPMALSQKVKTPDLKEVPIDNQQLADTLVGLCTVYGCNIIHLLGNEAYIKGLMIEIGDKEIEKYSTKNIKIEVN